MTDRHALPRAAGSIRLIGEKKNHRLSRWVAFLSSLEPTENYFSWVVVRYGIGKSYLKGIHTPPSEYYVITKDLKKKGYRTKSVAVLVPKIGK